MANKYRCYPKNKEMESAISSYCGQRRYLWNLLVEQFNYWHPGCKPPTNKELFKQLTQLRKGPSFLRATQPCSNKLSRILSKLKLLSLKVRKVDRNLRKRVLTMGLEFETLKLRRSIKNGARSMSLKWDG